MVNRALTVWVHSGAILKLTSLFGLVALMTQFDSLIFAAAGEFVSLQRPGRDDASRLDALALPLFDQLSIEGKRRIAAVLSECRNIIPEKLIEALVLQPLDVSASLLISRAEIPDAMLEKAIALKGAPHARVIALKHNISQSVKIRIDALIESIVPMTEIASMQLALNTRETNSRAPAITEVKSTAQTELELAQNRLRQIMMRKPMPEANQNLTPSPAAFEKGQEPNIVARLINLALEDDSDFLSTALADEWVAPFVAVRPLVQRNALQNLAALLKGLDFGATDTFAILSAFNPSAFASRESVAAFYVRFQKVTDADIHTLTQNFRSIAPQENWSESTAA